MRRCFVLLAAALATVGSAVAPTVASAAPHHNRGLTINSAPNPIISGQGVLIYGQLNGPDSANQVIVLYHRIPPQDRFTIIGLTRTNSTGIYEFIRQEGVVLTSRSWFVRGPGDTHSRTVHEHVAALVGLAASTTGAVTGQRVLFTGRVSPSHPFERVLLQEQNGLSGNGWMTVASTLTTGGSNFAFAHRFVRPGDHTLRAVFVGDARNDRGESDTLTVTVQQRQVPDFTIHTSSPIIGIGQSATISGVLDQPGGSTPQASTEVTLWGLQDGGNWQALATTSTKGDGSYGFTVSPAHNTAYRVRTTLAPARHTAVLYEGVQDAVTISASSLTGLVGNTITLTGTVAPPHFGHVIYLQRLGTDGYWHRVAMTWVVSGSTFSFAYPLTQPGTLQLRARITGGPENVGAASPPVTITVSGKAAPVVGLPPAS